MKRGLAPSTGLVSALPLFDGLDLVDPGELVLGGHELRLTSLEESAEEFRQGSGVFDRSWLDVCRDDLAQATARVRPAPHLGIGATIAKLATWEPPHQPKTPRAAIDLIAADLREFVARESIDHLIVLNLASTEPPFALEATHQSWDRLKRELGKPDETLLPSSSLYAIAALEAGHTHINFTPSLGSSFPAAYELAESTKAIHAGKDGKTGETLLKTVLAPMFAHRNLDVMSWVGHNIFGNRDGVVLDDPANKASKVGSKDKVVTSILGYKPSTLVSIEYIPDMGDWKTAWDHIHFRGFLGAKMKMQFIWEGCDSLLAAPLAIDLVRLADWEKRRGTIGPLKHLASFFKSPEGVEEHDFFEQFRLLVDHVDQAKKTDVR